MSQNKKVFAIIPSAGSGTRFSSNIPKQYFKINNETIIEKTLKDCTLGIICENEIDIEKKLSKFINDFILNGKNPILGNRKKIENRFK